MNFKSLIFLFSCILVVYPSLSQAQVLEDSTLSTEVSTDNNRDFTVNQGKQQGNNLFHSFQKFSIPDNGSVSFNNAATIQNIISRVTGTSISEIDGLIQANGTANLFLLNPNGIVFGSNARLNIGGSFAGTTAESLLFEDGTEFSSKANEPLLTVSTPLGLQFGSNPGEIINRASFSIPNPLDPTGQDRLKLGLTAAPEKTLALIGNGITFDGGAVSAPIGNVELGSVAKNSFVYLKPAIQGWQADYADVNQFKDLKLDNLASVDTSGEGGGNVNIWGSNIQLLNGSAITSNTLGTLDGGTIQIQASNLLEINGSDRSSTKLDPLLAGIEIFLPFASQISSNTFGAGRGGDIEITTGDFRLVDGGAIELQTLPGSTGNSGNLLLMANTIKLNGSRPLLEVGENAIDLINPFISLDTALEVNQASEISTVSIGEGNAGNITITTNDLILEDAATVSSSPFGSGDGGNINIDSLKSVRVFGTSPRTGSASSSITANSFANGDAGDINLTTGKLTIGDGGLVISSTSGMGDSGNININSSSVEISGFRTSDELPSLISAQTQDGGDGGSISIATDNLRISDHASLSVQGTGSSVPGNLLVDANSIELRSGGSITATTQFQSGGNISLNIEDNLTLKESSRVSARAFNNANGGNVNIDAKFIIAFPQQNNDILATAVFGNGGNITINTEGIFGIEEGNSMSSNLSNDLDASSEFGLSGTVATPFPNLSGVDQLFLLPTDFVDVNYLFDNSFCKVSRNSQFIATGRGGIPLEPEQNFFSEHTWSDWRMVKEVEEQRSRGAGGQGSREDGEMGRQGVKRISLIQGWVTDEDGNVSLTDKPLVVNAQQSGWNTFGCNRLKSNS